ncbi:DUF262 domain-containing protein [Mesorhizobium sp. KR1-2]|uniref:GmrSD restriction endonuclease domain-containing protein n=1 Tax=Mesorhizobium sp. KR1-2 TaxID=3156609 RepID=UPI0032B5FAA4
MGDQLSIRRLIDRATSGDIRIPAFQRDFVWEPEQVSFLLDSIYKGFPIGTVILWRTDTRLITEKNLGSFQLPEPAKDYPVNYVLDGQQRLTSLFSTFQNELKPISSDWIDIYFDVYAKENIQESLFMALEDGEVDPNRHFPVKTIFDPPSYRKAMLQFPDEILDRIDNMASRFREYLIQNETFESSDRNAVAIVFERINRSGTELNVFELLSAWSWSEDFDLVEKFGELQTKIASHGYDDLIVDKDLQLRICAGVITGETTPSKILDLQGADIRGRFVEIENGILGAIDFLKKQLHITHFKLLPFPGILVPLSCYFATTSADGVSYNDRQRSILERWFWRSVLGRRFSSDVNERQATDISEMIALKNDPNYEFKQPKAEIRVDFRSGNFSSGTANSKTLIIMLNRNDPRSFISGARVDTDLVLKKGSKHEYHHIFPQAHLERKGLDKREINVLSNICFLTRSDNNNIKDKAPNLYINEIPNEQRPEYLDRALCPKDTADLDYDIFINKRTEMLAQYATTLMA